MRSTIIAILSVFLLSGCATGPQTPEEKAAVLRTLVNAATVTGLAAGFDEDEKVERAEVAAQLVEWVGGIQSALANDSALSWGSLKEFFTDTLPTSPSWPPEVGAGISSAFSILSLYFNPPEVSIPLSDDQLLYFRAFLDGVISGATPFVGGP